MSDSLIGTTLRDGRYAVCGVLGEGSQGATVEAVDKRDGALVAIKRFQVRGARSWKDVELAEREARVLMRLSHPLLPRATEHFEEGGALYLVMEKVEGETLAALQGASRADVVRFLRDAARVLEYLHGQEPRVIHRDIKPANVIRRPARDGKPAAHVLVDFGSVRDSLKPAGGSTVVGTFGYMAPEQFQGRALPQSDVYAVGATALHMLTGEEPENLPHRGLAIDVRAVLGADDPLCEPLTQMLEPDPDKRPARIAPLLSAFPEDAPEEPRRRRRKRRPRTAPEPARTMPPIAVPVLMIAVAIARVAVAVALRGVVPVVLMLLALVFGDPLRRASRQVMAAGARADEAMKRALARALGRAPARIEEPPTKQRVEESVDHVLDEVDAAYDEVASEIESLRKRAK